MVLRYYQLSPRNARSKWSHKSIHCLTTRHHQLVKSFWQNESDTPNGAWELWSLIYCPGRLIYLFVYLCSVDYFDSIILTFSTLYCGALRVADGATRQRWQIRSSSYIASLNMTSVSRSLLALCILLDVVSSGKEWRKSAVFFGVPLPPAWHHFICSIASSNVREPQSLTCMNVRLVLASRVG